MVSCYSRNGLAGKRLNYLVDDSLIREHVEQALEIPAAIGMYLRHEDRDHLLGGIDGECGIEETTPVVFARRTEVRQGFFFSVDTEAESKGLSRAYLSQLIVRHQLNRLAAYQT